MVGLRSLAPILQVRRNVDAERFSGSGAVTSAANDREGTYESSTRSYSSGTDNVASAKEARRLYGLPTVRAALGHAFRGRGGLTEERAGASRLDTRQPRRFDKGQSSTVRSHSDPIGSQVHGGTATSWE